MASGNLMPSNAALRYNDANKIKKADSDHVSRDEAATNGLRATADVFPNRDFEGIATGRYTMGAGLPGLNEASYLPNHLANRLDDLDLNLSESFRKQCDAVVKSGKSLGSDIGFTNLIKSRFRCLQNTLKANLQLFLLHKRDFVPVMKRLFGDFPEVLQIIKTFNNRAIEEASQLGKETKIADKILDILYLNTNLTPAEMDEWGPGDIILPDLTIKGSLNNTRSVKTTAVDVARLAGLTPKESAFSAAPILGVANELHVNSSNVGANDESVSDDEEETKQSNSNGGVFDAERNLAELLSIMATQEAFLKQAYSDVDRAARSAHPDVDFTSDDWVEHVRTEAAKQSEAVKGTIDSLERLRNQRNQLEKRVEYEKGQAKSRAAAERKQRRRRTTSVFKAAVVVGDSSVEMSGYDIRTVFTTPDAATAALGNEEELGNLNRLSQLSLALAALNPSWTHLLLDIKGMWKQIMAVLTPEPVQTARAALTHWNTIKLEEKELVATFIQRFEGEIARVARAIPSIRDFLTENVRVAHIMNILVAANRPLINDFLTNFEARRSEKGLADRPTIVVDDIILPLIEREASKSTFADGVAAKDGGSNGKGKRGSGGGGKAGKKGGGNTQTTGGSKTVAAAGGATSAIGQQRERAPGKPKHQKKQQSGGGGKKNGQGSGADVKKGGGADAKKYPKCDNCCTFWHPPGKCPYPPNNPVVCFDCLNYGHTRKSCPEARGRTTFNDGEKPQYCQSRCVCFEAIFGSITSG